MLSFDVLIPEYFALLLFSLIESLPSTIDTDEMTEKIPSTEIYKNLFEKFLENISSMIIFVKDIHPLVKWMFVIINVTKKLMKAKIDQKYFYNLLGIMIPYSITVFFQTIEHSAWYIFLPLIYVYYKIIYTLFGIIIEIRNNLKKEDVPLSLSFNNT
ncbi:hypothetical protein CWI39_0842p0010 [Hamiltosporidium magnivora]|uniref:Uncharacterized protein n=1 Tax=Hamiltosporidium magnivora TaxID=148818 RepID=A0A4Q9L8Z6_9MICR|nr:hypothetical protein CWI39_0842p0010 [Hamiltosporidium magnivora]